MNKMIYIISKRMKEKKITQTKIAKIVGVRQQYISNIVLGKVKSPSFEIVVKIAEVLDIDLNQFKQKGEDFEKRNHD